VHIEAVFIQILFLQKNTHLYSADQDAVVVVAAVVVVVVVVVCQRVAQGPRKATPWDSGE
jgi:hypothetical protein